ncbi:GreA/GreB family elongation factor [Patescibacteria group bacterium]|nr:GreA/GreB family elongation factor [Patescibacteria group bacterium]
MGDKIFYISKKKYEELKKEYKNLLALELKKTKGDIPRLLESEDVNLEFVNFQEDLGFLGSRIDELENILKNYQIIVAPSKEKQREIGLGSIVTVAVDGEKDQFVITGTLEANPSLGRISNESPVGRALLGHKAGDMVVVSSPVNTTYMIKKIKYLSA